MQKYLFLASNPAVEAVQLTLSSFGDSSDKWHVFLEIKMERIIYGYVIASQESFTERFVLLAS